MKRPKLAIATCGAVLMLIGNVSAQTSLTIYGIVDAGLVHERGGAAGDVTKLTSGVQSGSRLGFKAMEDLGGGLSAKFLLESGFNMDTGTMGQGNRLFGRQSWVGLSGRWGDVMLGRQYTPHYLALDQIDPFATGLAGSSTNLMSTVDRMDNAIKFATPDWRGLTGELVYGMGEVPGDSSSNRQLGGAIGYASGPLVLKIAHHRVENSTGTDHARTSLVGGKYDFGPAAASLGVGLNQGIGEADNRDYMLGVTVPVGAGEVLASFIRKDDRTGLNADADQWALGYTHALSKRTNFYTSFAHINNDPGAAFTVGNASELGSGNKAINIGIRHKF